MPETPGEIIPAGRVGGGEPTNVNFNISAVDAQGVEDVLVRQKGHIIRMIREAANEHGQPFLEDISDGSYTQLMAIDYQNVLPDPNYQVGSDGGDGTAVMQQGQRPWFCICISKFKSPIMKTRTNSGRMVARALKSHQWDINISYNPMTRTEFEPVYNFLINRRGSLKPFFVSLPQYRNPQDNTMAGTT